MDTSDPLDRALDGILAWVVVVLLALVLLRAAILVPMLLLPLLGVAVLGTVWSRRRARR